MVFILTSLYVLFYFTVNIDLLKLSCNYLMYHPPMNNNIRITGIQILISIWATLYFIFSSRGKSQYLYLFIYMLLMTFLFWLGGRGTLLAFIITFVFFSVPLYRLCENVRKTILLLVATTLISLFLSNHLSVCPWNGILTRISSNVELINQNDSIKVINELSSNRVDIYKFVYKNMEGHWLTGLGPQAYFYFPNRTSNIQPHSFILQFIIEWGLFGALAFLVLMGLAFYTGIKNNVFKSHRCNENLFAGMIIFSLTLQGFFDGTYYHAQPLFYLSIAYALWLQSHSNNCPQNRSYE